MIAALIKFLFIALGGTIACATLLLSYESAKRGGYKGENDGAIIWFSIAGGIVIALTAMGISGSPHMMGH